MLSNLFSNADRATTSTTDLTTSLSPQVVPGKSALDLTVQLNRSTSEPLQQALQGAETALSQFAADRAFTAKMNVAFGDRWNPQVAKQLFQAWAAHDFRNLPKLEIRLGAEINHANGAFASATNTIYISRDFLAQNASNPKAVTSVLVEEIGHAIDFRINKFDAAGDEGDIFSRLVRGEKISASELLQLKAEDDHAVVKINGRATAIEMSQIAMVSLNGRIYQSSQGMNNKIYTRSSTDGVNWTPWNENGGDTSSAPVLASLNGQIYQAHRGMDNKIYMRSSSNGVTWSSWAEGISGGETLSTPAMTASNGALYQSHRGMDNKIYTRSSTDGTNWTVWKGDGGETPSAPVLADFNGKLFQSFRGLDNRIYTRSSTNGGTSWTLSNNSDIRETLSTPSMAAFNGKLYQSVRGTDNKLYTRSSTNGDTWTQWTSSGADLTPDAPSLAVANGRLYQSRQGTDNKIYTRFTTNGVDWSSWNSTVGDTPTESSDIGVWRATYLNTNNLTGSVVINRVESAINYDWGTGSPDARINQDNFSVRWEGKFYFNQAQYTFKPNMDDGARIWIDGQLVNDSWNSPSTTNFTRDMTAGLHQIKVEYRELGGNARAIFSTEEQTGVWKAAYYNNADLSGASVVNRVETAINYDWGTGSPDVRLNRDNFSARWEGKFYFDGGSYTFKPNTDDGARIWVDGQLMRDSWTSSTNTNFSRTMTTGFHQIKVEYRELSGNAYAKFSWDKNASSNYLAELSSMTTSDWDRVGGESAQYGKYKSYTEGDLVQKDMSNTVLKVYEDLSTTIFGTVNLVTTGYAYDNGYLSLKAGYHAGMDINASKGTSIKAATNGIVVKSYLGKRKDGTSYGYVVGVDETDSNGQKTGRRWWYVHNDSSIVKEGDKVLAGQTEIAKVGDEGHLHIAVTDSSQATDPGNGNSVQDVLNRTMSPLQAFWKSKNGVYGVT